MEFVFSDQPLPTRQTKSVFLAGPSPRNAEVQDWRPAFVEELRRQGFDGTVFIPIPRSKFEGGEQPAFRDGWGYEDQVQWECDARAMSDLVVFWVPRTLDRTRTDLGMPAFTTNFELGEDLHSGKVVYGRPSDAVKMSYLDERVVAAGIAVHETMASLAQDAIAQLGEGALREGGAAQVPLMVWKTPAFQSWYANLRAAGNRLDGARVLSTAFVGNRFLFCFMLKVKVWVAKEQRHKSNEFFVARPDISTVVAVYQEPRTGMSLVGANAHLALVPPVTHVVLVREFRSTVNNETGFVVELPAGSCAKPGTPADFNAQQELHEETGLLVANLSRFKRVSRRQLAATFSVHQAEVYAVMLTREEFDQLRAQAATGQPCGDPSQADGESSERTYVELTTVDKMFSLPLDYATLGMVLEGLRALGMPRP